MPEVDGCEHLCPDCDALWYHILAEREHCQIPLLKWRCSRCEKAHQAKLVEAFHKMVDMPTTKAGSFYLCGKERMEEELLNDTAPQTSIVLVYRPTTEALGACAEFARQCESAAGVTEVRKILDDSRGAESAARNLWLFRGQLTLIAEAELAHRMMLRSKRFSRTLTAKAKAMGVRVKEKSLDKKHAKKSKNFSEAELQALAAKLAELGISPEKLKEMLG